MQAEILNQLQRDCAGKQRVALVTRLKDGEQVLLYPDRESLGRLPISASQQVAITALLMQGNSDKLPDQENELFVRSYVPPYRLIIIGAVHIAQSLAPMALAAGYEVTIIDPRRGFANGERFPTVELINAWPEDVLPELALDTQTALVTLTHDPKIDDGALIHALRSDAFYIGALGSQRTHTSRIKRLEESGLEKETDRLCAPVGLKLGGRAPSEIAVSILAQVIQHRYGELIP